MRVKALALPILALVIIGSILLGIGIVWLIGNNAIASATQPQTGVGENKFKVIFKTYITSTGDVKTHILGIQLPNVPSIKPLSIIEQLGQPVSVKVTWFLYKYNPSEDRFDLVFGGSGEKVVSTKIGKVEEIEFTLNIPETGIYMLQVYTEAEGYILSIDGFNEVFEVVG